MKHIIGFNEYLNEGMKSENIINFMVEIVLERINLETIVANFNEKYKRKATIEYTYKTFFNAYKEHEFIKNMLDFFKKSNRDPKIIFRFEGRYSYDTHQNPDIDKNGSYNKDTSNIEINIYEIGTNISKIKRTLSHELRHLYDDIVRKGTNTLYDKEDDLAYHDKPSEIRAKITGFVNSYTDWSKDINEIIKDAELAIKSENYDRKKLIKLIHAIKTAGLDKHIIIPTKKLEGRKSDIDSFIKEMNIYELFNDYKKEHRIIEIDNSILSINTVDEITGELGYPLIDMLLNIYESKNINIVIGANNLELIDVLKTKYKLDVIRIRQKYHWSVKGSLKVKFLLSKQGKIPNYETIATTDKVGVEYDKILKTFYDKHHIPTSETLTKYLKEIGLDSSNYVITFVQNIIDLGKIIYLYSEFYDKWKDMLNFSESDVYYIEIKNGDNIAKLYLVNGERSKVILMDRVKSTSLKFEKVN